jgi:hypothetical protein
MSLIGALKATKKTAPFYSAVDEALAAIKRPKGTGAEFYTELTKQAGVKKAELADRKLEQAFKAKGKMTKEEAQQVLADNPPPKVEDRQLTEISDYERDKMLEERLETSGYDYMGEVPARRLREWNEEIDENLEKFGDYKTAGGQNYREILLKLPKSDTKNGDKNYWSTHFLQDPNVLAHMRVQDRKGPNGEKILHVEEIQSDWHQAGRKKGYKPDDYIEQSNALEQEFRNLVNKRGQLRDEAERIGYRGEGHKALVEEANSITPRLMQLQEQRDNMQNVINYGVPDAPFKKNWHELAMKRLLNYAADNGYDSIAITPGAEQAKRYPRQVESEKIAQEQGMKGFYDQILPSYLNTFGKPYGAQVEQMPIDVGGFKVNRDSNELPFRLESATSPDIISRFATPEEAWAEAGKLGSIPLHSFKITPEMRESIKQKGLPLYQQVGIPTAGAGAASQMLEPEEESGLATGGIVKSAVKQAQLAKLAKMRQEMAPRAEAVKALIARDQNRYLADVVPNSLTNAEIEAEIKRMAAKAPMFMKPSALTELKKIVQQEKGDYGSRRVERAADEVPNLEKMYTLDALKERFLGDNAKALMTMSPADFEKFASELQGKTSVGPKAAESAKQGDISKYTVPTDEYVKHLERIAMFDSVPYLNLAKEEVGLPLLPYISGHEGRHRSRALAGRGEKSNLVGITPTMDLREGLPRRSQEEFIEAMKKELELSGGLVLPQSEPMLGGRPPIILPDVYAKGGAVKPKVKDAKSGKVTMTKNRDTMFMELSNKKLKRK